MTSEEYYAGIKAELDSDPLGLGYAAVRGDDWAVASLLNAKGRPGHVPAREVVAILARSLIWGMVPLAVLHRKLPDGSDCPFPLFNLFSTVHLAAFSTVEPPLRLERKPLGTALGLIPDALIPAAVKTAILAAEVPVSRSEELWGYGAVATPEDVGASR